MTALLAILSAIIGNKVVMTVFAAVAGGIGLYIAGGINRAKKEAVKQVEAKIAAAEDRLEMNREASAEGRKAAGMTDAAARAEAEKWARR
ncbi:hypothetical protein NMG46_27675 [Mesorhizobium sp. LMG 17147]|uniref:hypothetical protein n=1 Tax=Mesorhizobium sp. LMG 17147 TaxID=2963091 RepID=UPI0020C9D9CC|nr:hypothetical protein [Mesorhizobium sp. LMG 17147]MCP9233945.1 hypothetical protein [Mesorhizobium sp. LMG 17147]